MKTKLYIILFMVLITAVATAAMTGAKVGLQSRIERNRAILERRLQLEALGILPETPTPAEVDRVWKERVEEQEWSGERILVAWRSPEKETPLAVGIPYRAMGVWGPFTGMVALDPAFEKIVGFVVYRHQETPGLGARMTKDEYRAQFRGKPADRPDEQGRYLVFVPPTAEPSGEREVQAISGATGTTNGLRDMFNDVLKRAQNELKPERPW